MNLDTQFDAVRQLPLEVRFEQVSQLIYQQPSLPIKGNISLGLKIIIASMIVGPCIYMAYKYFNDKLGQHPEIETPFQNEPQFQSQTQLLAIDTLAPASSSFSEIPRQNETLISDSLFHLKQDPVFVTSKLVNDSIFLPADLNLSPAQMTVEGPNINMINPSADQLDSNVQLKNYTDGTPSREIVPDSLGIPNQEYSFTITQNDTEKEVWDKINTARESCLTLLMSKFKKRHGKITHIKLAYAISDDKCRQQVFRTVELKGFRSYSFGWGTDDNGRIINFWDQINEEETKNIENVYDNHSFTKFNCK